MFRALLCSSSGGQIVLYFKPLHVSSTYAHRQDGKSVLYSIWYHHTCRWPSGAQVERGLCTGRPPTGVMITDAL